MQHPPPSTDDLEKLCKIDVKKKKNQPHTHIENAKISSAAVKNVNVARTERVAVGQAAKREREEASERGAAAAPRRQLFLFCTPIFM